MLSRKADHRIAQVGKDVKDHRVQPQSNPLPTGALCALNEHNLMLLSDSYFSLASKAVELCWHDALLRLISSYAW